MICCLIKVFILCSALHAISVIAGDCVSFRSGSIQENPAAARYLTFARVPPPLIVAGFKAKDPFIVAGVDGDGGDGDGGDGDGGGNKSSNSRFHHWYCCFVFGF